MALRDLLHTILHLASVRIKVPLLHLLAKATGLASVSRLRVKVSRSHVVTFTWFDRALCLKTLMWLSEYHGIVEHTVGGGVVKRAFRRPWP